MVDRHHNSWRFPLHSLTTYFSSWKNWCAIDLSLVEAALSPPGVPQFVICVSLLFQCHFDVIWCVWLVNLISPPQKGPFCVFVMAFASVFTCVWSLLKVMSQPMHSACCHNYDSVSRLCWLINLVNNFPEVQVCIGHIAWVSMSCVGWSVGLFLCVCANTELTHFCPYWLIPISFCVQGLERKSQSIWFHHRGS